MNRAAQLQVAQRNYDNASPPEPVDYDYTEADSEIAFAVVNADEVAELVMEVRESAGLLNWIAYNVDLPIRYLKAFRALDRRAKDYDSRADAIVEQAA